MRSRHELAEKLREISKKPGTNKEIKKKLETVQYMEIKYEEKKPQALLISEHQPIKIGVFHQPVRFSQRINQKNNNIQLVYRISAMEKHEQPMDLQSWLPTSCRKMKIKRKKRKSEILSRIEELLSKGKDILLLPEPSEESIFIDINTEKKEITVPSFNLLPEEILQKIFHYFSLRERCQNLSPVCKTWYYILKNPMFWNHLEFSGDKVSSKIILQIVNSCPMLRSLKLTAVSDAAIILQSLNCDMSKIIELGVRYCPMNGIDCVHILLQVISSLSNLEVLDIKGTEFKSHRFFTELCLLKNLKSLDLGANRYLQIWDLMTISMNCRRIESLKICDIPSDIAQDEKLKDENFLFIIRNLKSSLIHLEYDMQRLGNPAYLVIPECKNLKTLCLSNCLFLTGEMLRKFSQLENLKILTLIRAINLTSEDLKCLFNDGRLNKIEKLDVSGCWRMDETALKAIINRLPSLKSLSIKNCKLIKAKDLKLISRCELLSALNIAHIGIGMEDLPEIVICLRQLRTLIVDKNTYEPELAANIIATLPGLKIEVSE